jgi:hypothetical protein
MLLGLFWHILGRSSMPISVFSAGKALERRCELADLLGGIERRAKSVKFWALIA